MRLRVRTEARPIWDVKNITDNGVPGEGTEIPRYKPKHNSSHRSTSNLLISSRKQIPQCSLNKNHTTPKCRKQSEKQMMRGGPAFLGKKNTVLRPGLA